MWVTRADVGDELVLVPLLLRTSLITCPLFRVDTHPYSYSILKVQEMYFANPPIEPNVETYKEVMTVLIKYDDR